MFVQLENVSSVNSISSLRYGTYIVRNSIFHGDDFSASVFLYRFSGDADDCAADLIFVDPEGRVFFRDFLCLPDGDWRDSCGHRSIDLQELFPPELLGLAPVDVQESMLEHRGMYEE